MWRASDDGQLQLQVTIFGLPTKQMSIATARSLTRRLQLWSMWQQAARSLHLHPILLHKADGKRIVLEAAQKDTKVSTHAVNPLTTTEAPAPRRQVFAIPSCCMASVISTIQGNIP